jgi:hypothetical protein
LIDINYLKRVVQKTSILWNILPQRLIGLNEKWEDGAGHIENLVTIIVEVTTQSTNYHTAAAKYKNNN